MTVYRNFHRLRYQLVSDRLLHERCGDVCSDLLGDVLINMIPRFVDCRQPVIGPGPRHGFANALKCLILVLKSSSPWSRMQ
jgi:hypothetical protein